MTVAQQLKAEAMQQGMQQGIQKKGIEIARKILAAGQPLSFAKQVTGLSEEQLKAIQH